MSEQRAETAMDDVAQRVRRELRDTVGLICRSGGGVVFEEFPGALQEKPPPGTHHALLAAAEALAEALARLDATTRRRHPL